MTNYLMEVPAGSGAGAIITQVGLIALMFGFLYFFMIRPQKKKDKELSNMRSSLEVGDEIITIGGIIGIVVSIKEEAVVIETGSDRSKIRISKWAIQSNLSTKAVQAPVAKAEKEKDSEKDKEKEKNE